MSRKKNGDSQEMVESRRPSDRSNKILRIIALLKDLFGLINVIVFLIPALVSIGVWIGSYLADLMWLALLAEYIAVVFLSIFVVITILRQRKTILALRNRQEIMGKQIKQFFRVSCPSCGNWIEIDFPNYASSGVHVADGQPNGSFWRSTEEREVQCKKCNKRVHIDIPHSQTFKVHKSSD